jgi:hypothetical protein
MVRGGSLESVAQAVHERWREEQLDNDLPAPLWADLDESRKESSRDQARDIAVKLSMIGCAIAPLRDWEAADFTFTDEDIERLGRAEHDRWIRERRAAGWTLGDKDVQRKKTPYLVPFEDLPPHIAEFDRIVVRAIPALLASVGLQVIRTTTRLRPKGTGPASSK